MRLPLAVLMICLVSAGCAHNDKPGFTEDIADALLIFHDPNPCDIHVSDYFDRPPYKYMWYYRTEVQNNLSVPLRITDFGFYTYENGKWLPMNVELRKIIEDGSEKYEYVPLMRLYTSREFEDWYSDGPRTRCQQTGQAG